MKCPNCGRNIKNGSVKCPKCKAYCGRDTRSSDNDVFRSSARTPNNGGYTQQNTNNSGQVYTGIQHDSQNEDGMFFSNESSRIKYDNTETISVEHYSESNPYDSNVYKEEPPVINSSAHQDEFIAKNIVEFSHHRFGRDVVTKLLFQLIILSIISLICLLCDIIIDDTRLTVPITAGYTVALMCFSYAAVKTCRKKYTVIISILTFLQAVPVFIVLDINCVDTSGKPTYTFVQVFFVYLPLTAELVYCLRCNMTMNRFNDHWEAYQHRGIYYIDNEIDRDYKFFKSKDTDDTDDTEDNYTQLQEDLANHR